jgi:hypothetical protein
MKRAIVAVAIAAISTTAFATGKKPEKPSKPDHSTVAQASAAGVGIAASSSKSQAVASSASISAGGAAEAVGGSATGGNAIGQGGSASNGNQSQSLTVNNVEPSDVRIRNTPSVNAWAAPPSATCVVTTGGAVNVPGFGGGISTGVIDKQCEARENARFLSALGATMEAVRVLCRASADVAKEVVECRDISEEHEKRANEKSRNVTVYPVTN